MLAVFKRELQSYFYSAIGYVFMGCFLVIAGIFFAFGNVLSASSSVGTLFSNVSFIFIPVSYTHLDVYKRQGFDGACLRDLPYEEACRRIREFRGVGEKVADCVLLFSCGQRAAFPVDTWMEKVLCGWYGLHGTRASLKRQACLLYTSRCV